MLPERFTPQLLSQLETLRIRARRAYLGSRQGGHVSIRRGHGIEFSDYRKYEQGDSPRLIDWGLYARTDKLFVKRFNEEQDLSVLIMLDTSASMGTPKEDGKWAMARDLALATAYLAIMQQDAVVFSALGREVASPVYRGARSFHSLAEKAMQQKPQSVFSFESEVMKAASQVRFPGVGVFISDFLAPISGFQRSFEILRSKNLELTAIQVIGAADLDPFGLEDNLDLRDSETGAVMSVEATFEVRQRYQDKFQRHCQALRDYFVNCGTRYSAVRSDEDLAAAMQRSFSILSLAQ